MPVLTTIEQVLCGGTAGAVTLLARSPGLSPARARAVVELCAGVGDLPPDSPEILFAHPTGRDAVAVGRCRTTGSAVRFHVLVVPVGVYEAQAGDPFRLAALVPATWEAAELPPLPPPSGRADPRTVAEVRAVLQREDGPTLLGAAQLLVDGGRFLAVREAPAADLVARLWVLLPLSDRSRVRMITFAVRPRSTFDVVVVPRAEPNDFPGVVTESAAADYPEGYYELHLQMAAEDGDQAELDRLYARRSLAQTWRLAVVMAVVLGLMLLFGLAVGAVRPR